MNTLIDYMYRDAGNWKQYPGEPLIVSGTLTDDERSAFWLACEDGEHFVAGQVTPGMDDHGYTELVGIETTDREPNDPRTAQELLAEFEAASKAGWDAVAECKRLGIPLEA